MKKEIEKQELEAKKMFDNLKKHLGEQVVIAYSHYGHLEVETGELSEVNDFINVVVGCTGVPFLGYGCAILKIQTQANEVLYYNNNVSMHYDLRTDEAIDYEKRKIFGNRIVDETIKKRKEAEKKWQEFLEKSAKAAQRDKASLQEEGLALIKPETKDDWMEFTENNCQDGYSCCVVRATVDMLKAMEDPACSFQEAENEIFNEKHGLTGFQAGAVANCLAHFAKRGEEFRIYWNKQWGIEDEETKGTVNPAVFTIGK